MSEALKLPDSWVHASVDDLADINPKSFCPLPAAANELVHFVPMGAVVEEFGGIDVSGKRLLSEVQKGYTSFLAGDVIFAKITPCMENGKLAVLPELPRHLAYGSTEFHVLRAKAGVLPEWLAYYLSQSQFRKLARQNMAGSAGQLRVSTSWLADEKLPLPPFAEQQRIISKLVELYANLDAGVAELQAAQKKLALYRQSLLKAAVEGELTAEWRIKNPGLESGSELLARILENHRNSWEMRRLEKASAQGKVLSGKWRENYVPPADVDLAGLPDLPEGWCWGAIEQLGDVQLGRQRSPDKVKGENPVKYIRAANITEQGVDLRDVLEMDFSESEQETFALQVGDVVLTEASGSAEHVGRPAVWKDVEGLYCFQNTVIRFRPCGVISSFAFYSFLAMQKLGVFRKLSGGVGINHLSAGKFSRLAMALPSIEEQKAIVELLEMGLKSCDGQMKVIDKALKQAAAQRQNILRAAFSGQLVPQDTNDEPASVLLERIRAEKERAGKEAKARKSRTPRKTATAAAPQLFE